jgi:hypothetical protein
MGFEDVLGYAALAGVALIVIGTILLALFPRWGGFRVQRADEAPPSPIEVIVKALAAAFSSFLTIVRDMVTGEAGKYHPGQVLIAVGFLLFLLCALLWVVTQVAGG